MPRSPADPVTVRRVPHGPRLHLLNTFLRRPATTGAVAPSSVGLARRLAAVVPQRPGAIVVELGPGTGSVSDVIDARLPAGGRHIAVELDPAMVGYLRRTHPDLEVVHGDARDLRALLAARGVDHVDAVVCGLPWALFDDATQHAVLAEVGRVIGPDGAFTTFAYSHGMIIPAARRFRATLRDRFSEVLVGATVWANLPPAFVYECRNPMSA